MSVQPDKAQPDVADDPAGQRSALLRRVAVAGGLIGMLIAALAVFDASRRPPEPAPGVTAPAQPEAPPAPAEPPAEETALPTLPSLTMSDDAPVEAANVDLPDTPPPLPEGTSLPTVPQAAPEPPPVMPPAAAPPRVAVPSAAPRASPPAAQPPGVQEAPARAPSVPAISRVPAAPTMPPQGYLVQVGVFSSVANAEEVRARLALNGIPSQIEARVHVGPFKSRAEADAARVRLRALGMDSAPPAPARVSAPAR